MNLSNLVYKGSCIATGSVLMNAERNLQAFVTEQRSQDTGERHRYLCLMVWEQEEQPRKLVEEKETHLYLIH